MVDEFYGRSIIPELVVTTVVPEEHIDNIQVIHDSIEKLVEEKKEKKKRKHQSTTKKEAIKKAKGYSLQSKQDRVVKVQKMHMKVGSSRTVVFNIEKNGDVDLPSDIPLSEQATTSATIVDTVPIAEETTDDGGRTRPKVPHDETS